MLRSMPSRALRSSHKQCCSRLESVCLQHQADKEMEGNLHSFRRSSIELVDFPIHDILVFIC